jgi:uncharacterized membrane protein YhhN
MKLAYLTTGFTALCTLALLASEWRHSQLGKWLSKPLASLGFVATAVVLGAPESRYGQAVLAALGLSLVGDVLLIPRSKAIFRIGVLAFLCGHLAFLVAFFQRPINVRVSAAVLGGAAGLALIVGRWLLERVEGGMRGPVIAYIAVISTMLAAAAGTRVPLIAVGALAFYFSDLSVARDRFVAPGFINRAWGLPLYYGAQLLLGWSVRI